LPSHSVFTIHRENALTPCFSANPDGKAVATFPGFAQGCNARQVQKENGPEASGQRIRQLNALEYSDVLGGFHDKNCGPDRLHTAERPQNRRKKRHPLVNEDLPRRRAGQFAAATPRHYVDFHEDKSAPLHRCPFWLFRHRGNC
jgi:hypothetical protein